MNDVILGLSSLPKHIPSKYFYNNEGARLFEKICKLEDYYPTRTEVGILKNNATEIAKYLGSNVTLIEYGSGSLEKVIYY